MTAAAQSPAAPTDPDSPRAASVMPDRLSRVLGVVRRLIDYGRQLAGSLQQRAAAPGFALFAMPFGTADVAIILARITAGLRRAAALEALLCRRAERGQDLAPASVRMPAASGISGPAAPPAIQPEPPPEEQPQDPRLARLPTEQEIAAEIRRRPIGAVIADICHDLGIMPGHLDRAFWDELHHAIVCYGGNLMGFIVRSDRWQFAGSLPDHDGPAEPRWPATPPRTLAPSTHPP